MSNSKHDVDHYDANYENFGSKVFTKVRQEAFGEDIGQTGWLTVEEQDQFISWLDLGAGTRLLDIACGSGRPTMRIAREIACDVVGVDLHEDAVASARAHAKDTGLDKRAEFHHANCGARLDFNDQTFDAIMCIDAINHLPDRRAVLDDWYRLTKPGGVVLFTDPIVVTGSITNQEVAVRASIGHFLFVPPGLNQEMLCEAGFTIERVENHTENMAKNARGWLEARGRHENELVELEGKDAFEGQQTFFETAARLAEENRLSRFAYLARKPR